jgi:hypothetical protein
MLRGDCEFGKRFAFRDESSWRCRGLSLVGRASSTWESRPPMDYSDKLLCGLSVLCGFHCCSSEFLEFSAAVAMIPLWAVPRHLRRTKKTSPDPISDEVLFWVKIRQPAAERPVTDRSLTGSVGRTSLGKGRALDSASLQSHQTRHAG